MRPINRYLKYIVFTMAGVAAVCLAIFAYAQQSDLPEGWEEPAQPLPPGSIRLEDVGKPKTPPPAQTAPAEPTPAPKPTAPAAAAETAPAAPAEPIPQDKGVYGSPKKYSGSQISTIPPVTGPQAQPPSSGAAPAGGTYGGAMSDLPPEWQEPAEPLPPGSVRIEDVGKKPAQPSTPTKAGTPPAAPKEQKSLSKEVVEETEVLGTGEKGEESYSKPSRWENY